MRNRIVPVGNVVLVLAAVLLPLPSTLAQEKKSPRVILLIRHAEKPADELSVDLSPAGSKRAAALAGLFAKSPSRPLPLPTPDFIFAARDSKHSRRCTETVAPLAGKLGLKVHAKIANEEFAKLAEEILGNPMYEGKTVLICWHHGNLPGLAKKLGATDAPDHWKGSVFDRVWQIAYGPSGKAAYADLPQRLFADDSKK